MKLILLILLLLVAVVVIIRFSSRKQNNPSGVASTSEVENRLEVVKSDFDGGVLEYIGIRIVAFLLTLITLGFGYPWAKCMIVRWTVNHSIIEGKRLKFHGTGIGLFGRWIIWVLLCIITIGIYAFWLSIAMEKWKIKNTSFAN